MTQRYRISTTESLSTGKQVTLTGNAAHYLSNVLRLKPGDSISIFSRADGEFTAHIANSSKKNVTLEIGAQTRLAETPTGLTVCFVPIKGGRLETIIEKATELGADVLQPVFSTRSVVDKVNLERAETIAREAAEQCERTSWPEIREPVKLLNLLGNWPTYMPLIYGDESGNSPSITTALQRAQSHPPLAGGQNRLGDFGGVVALDIHTTPSNPQKSGFGPPQAGDECQRHDLDQLHPSRWAILAGPEGGFTPDEFAALAKVKSTRGVSLGPRILRADTAIITLAAATLLAWGDWDQPPRAPA